MTIFKKSALKSGWFKFKWIFDNILHFVITAEITARIYAGWVYCKASQFKSLTSTFFLHWNSKCGSLEDQFRVGLSKHKHAVQHKVSLSSLWLCASRLLSPSLYAACSVTWLDLDTCTVLATWPSSRVNTPAAAHSGGGQSCALD